MGDAAAGTISSDREVVVINCPGLGVTFGREPHAHLRIGHAPPYDDVVPKLAGRVFAHDGRVVVANLHDSLALDIRIDGRALVPVPPGHWHAPPERTFDVLVTGTLTYELAVVVNSANNPTRVVPAGDPDSPEPPTGARPSLTARQREVLDAYIAPWPRAGHPRRTSRWPRPSASAAHSCGWSATASGASCSWPASPCAAWAIPGTRSPTPGPAIASRTRS